MVGVFVVAPFVVYPVFLMKALCFALFACAFNLLIGYVGPAVLRPRRVPRLGRLHRRRTPPRSGGGRRSWPSWPAPLAAAGLGLVIGALAIRRQGIYFAMITLALAQMLYFFCLQAPFTGGEDGIQAVPRGMLFGLIDLRNTLAMYFVGARDLPGRLPPDLPDHPLALRPGAQGHPGERAARALARLRGRPLQADRLRPVGGPVRAGRRHQGHRLPARLAHRRALDACRARWC